MNNTPLYRLGQADFIKGALTAVVAGVVVAIGTVIHATVTAPNFDLFSIDWGTVGHALINNAVIGAEGGFSGYILKNLFSDENGNVPALGKFGRFNRQ